MTDREYFEMIKKLFSSKGKKDDRITNNNN